MMMMMMMLLLPLLLVGGGRGAVGVALPHLCNTERCVLLQGLCVYHEELMARHKALEEADPRCCCSHCRCHDTIYLVDRLRYFHVLWALTSKN